MKAILLASILIFSSCSSRNQKPSNATSETKIEKPRGVTSEILETTAGVIIGGGILSAGALK